MVMWQANMMTRAFTLDCYMTTYSAMLACLKVLSGYMLLVTGRYILSILDTFTI